MLQIQKGSTRLLDNFEEKKDFCATALNKNFSEFEVSIVLGWGKRFFISSFVVYFAKKNVPLSTALTFNPLSLRSQISSSAVSHSRTSSLLFAPSHCLFRNNGRSCACRQPCLKRVRKWQRGRNCYRTETYLSNESGELAPLQFAFLTLTLTRERGAAKNTYEC